MNSKLPKAGRTQTQRSVGKKVYFLLCVIVLAKCSIFEMIQKLQSVKALMQAISLQSCAFISQILIVKINMRIIETKTL